MAQSDSRTVTSSRNCVPAHRAFATTALLAIVVGIRNAPFVQAQAAPQATTFEVASVKLAAKRVGREGGNRSRIEHTPTSLSMFNVSLSDCVQWAYGVPPFRVSAPDADSDSYDILAKTGAAVPVSQLRVMLQDLLANRFKLVLHREIRMLPVYELQVAKGGPRLPPPNASRSLVHASESLPRIEGDSFLFADASMAEFAQMLAQLRGIDMPVIDRTGIAGTFDIVLKSAPSAIREGDGAALFAIIQSQLGLKLLSAKAPMDVVVVDRAAKPAEN
jgi:uncharacterized protein (TIGR03435 family)